jgi:hypothetical protein
VSARRSAFTAYSHSPLGPLSPTAVGDGRRRTRPGEGCAICGPAAPRARARACELAACPSVAVRRRARAGGGCSVERPERARRARCSPRAARRARDFRLVQGGCMCVSTSCASLCELASQVVYVHIISWTSPSRPELRSSSARPPALRAAAAPTVHCGRAGARTRSRAAARRRMPVPDNACNDRMSIDSYNDRPE